MRGDRYKHMKAAAPTRNFVPVYNTGKECARSQNNMKALHDDIGAESQTKIYKGRPLASHSTGAKLCLHFEPRDPPTVWGGARRSAPSIHVIGDLPRKRY